MLLLLSVSIFMVLANCLIFQHILDMIIFKELDPQGPSALSSPMFSGFTGIPKQPGVAALVKVILTSVGVSLRGHRPCYLHHFQ